MDYRQNADRDELRARFTAWLDTLLKRAKLNYLERECEEPHESLDSLDEDQLPATEDAYMQTLFSDDPFGFTEDRLAKAFSELPLMRQQILKLLFVDEMKPRDIAKTELFSAICFKPEAKRLEVFTQDNRGGW